MAFEQFPYTNFHDLNLDWLLKTVKDTKDILDNTDIPKIVQDELTEMYNNGQLADLINQQILGDIQAQVDANTASIEAANEAIAANDASIEGLKVTATLAMLSEKDNVSGDPERGYSLCMVIYNKDLTEYAVLEHTETAESVCMRGDGSVWLISDDEIALLLP